MSEETRFQMTIVTQKRRPRGENEGEAARPGEGEQRHSTEGERHHHSAEGEHHHHSSQSERHGHSEGGHSREGAHAGSRRRHYQDYGTVDLGNLNGPRPKTEPERSVPAEPSKGAVQREFYDRYDAVLSRRYAKRSRSAVVRILAIALLMALIVVVSWIGISVLGEETGETLARPDVETIAVEPIDLG